ncbi:(deoxy)nucleoside triphosphate pyrophosphohydrolase [Actinophytocola glycyrrhizae]|uniref:8-oxo-dGTP diphosphatase n=1 Tax=Actinophytocola glycyrrhizae TaxID=2044873 RepID=A0ABV9RX62_9PSEU
MAGADVILSTTTLVDVPRRIVSAALPVHDFPLLGGWFRVVSVAVEGWSAVAVRGPRSFRLAVRLTTTPAGTDVTCSATFRAPGGPLAHRSRVLSALTSLAEGIRTRALALAGAPVIVGTAIVRGRRLLAQQRSYPADAAGLWELPGGRVEPGESDADAVVRECAEELGVLVEVGAPVGPDVALPKGKLLRIHRATIVGDARPHPHDHADLRWLTAGQLGTVPWLPADRVLLPALRQLLRGLP